MTLEQMIEVLRGDPNFNALREIADQLEQRAEASYDYMNGWEIGYARGKRDQLDESRASQGKAHLSPPSTRPANVSPESGNDDIAQGKAQPGESDDSRDEVGEVGEFGGVRFFKELKPNTLLFTRPWLDSEIEKSRMEADELCAKLNIEREPDPAVVEAGERLRAIIKEYVGLPIRETLADLETIMKGRG